MTALQPDTLFSTLLASTVHDIKNSLGTLHALIQQLTQKPELSQDPDLHQLEFEASRINHSLMQLLVMYKIGTHGFCLDVDEYPAIELINDALAQQARQTQLNGVAIDIECAEDLLCYADYQHVANALGTILNNAQRYSRGRIVFSAERQDGYIVFAIEDDGQGYPPAMLNADLDNPLAVDWISGNTGLGLYFVATIARLHKTKTRQGRVLIDNQSRLGGARFRLLLP